MKFTTLFFIAAIALSAAKSYAGSSPESEARHNLAHSASLLDAFCEPNCRGPVRTKTEIPAQPEKAKPAPIAHDAQDVPATSEPAEG